MIKQITDNLYQIEVKTNCLEPTLEVEGIKYTPVGSDGLIKTFEVTIYSNEVEIKLYCNELLIDKKVIYLTKNKEISNEDILSEIKQLILSYSDNLLKE